MTRGDSFVTYLLGKSLFKKYDWPAKYVFSITDYFLISIGSVYIENGNFLAFGSSFCFGYGKILPINDFACMFDEDWLIFS